MYKNPFELFGLPISAYVHEATLNQRYLEMMQDLHPDKFNGEDAFMKKSAEQIAAYANEAYQILKSPLTCIDAAIKAKNWTLPIEATTKDSILLIEMLELQELAQSGHDLRPFYQDALLQLEKALQDNLEEKTLEAYTRLKFLARLLGNH
jgi:DnaJ-domain-containing protein 1